METIILIIIIAILVFLIYKFIKPYTIKYDTTLFVTGGLGSGKTLTQVKIAVNLLQRMRLKWWFNNNIIRKIKNAYRKSKNKKAKKKGLQELPLLPSQPKPQLYSNIPICYKPNPFKKQREWACKLKKQHLILTEEMTQNAIVLVDELPQLVNQFNWDLEQVQHYVNEFISYFRHYYGGYFLANAQSMDDVVCQIRRKGNQAIWCYDFKKWFFGLFYTIRMCDIILNDNMKTFTTSFIEDNTKLHFGLFPPKGTYDTRCYSPRINNILTPLNKKYERWDKLKTSKVLRMEKYASPLDDTTTIQKKIAINNNVLNDDEKGTKEDERK